MKPIGGYTTRNGFTLIELLVVIAIIAILAAVLFPVFISAKNSAKLSKCTSHMSEVGKAVMLYAGDWNDMMPLDSYYRVGPVVYDFWNQPDSWVVLVGRYVKNPGVWQCPSSLPPGNGYNPDRRPGPNGLPKTISYFINGEIICKKLGSQIPQATRTVFFTEYAYLNHTAGVRPDPDGNYLPYGGYWGMNHGDGPDFSPDRKYNVVFCDGHVKLCNPTKLCTKDWVHAGK